MLKTIAMSYTVSLDKRTIQQWINAKLDKDAVKGKLQLMGLDADTIASYLNEFTRMKNSKRQFTGFVYTGIGAFLGFLSCILTLINPIPELYDLILFGLTSVAILVIFAGLYFLFE